MGEEGGLGPSLLLDESSSPVVLYFHPHLVQEEWPSCLHPPLAGQDICGQFNLHRSLNEVWASVRCRDLLTEL